MIDNKEELKEGSSLINGDKIDLKVLVAVMRKGKKRILLTSLLVITITLLVLLFIPNRYRAGAIILPKTGGVSQLDRLGGLASLAGVNLSSMVGETSEFPAEVYPTLVYSIPFLQKLMNAEYNFIGELEPMSFYHKEVSDTLGSFRKNLIRYTIYLPWTILDHFKNDTSSFIPKEDGHLLTISRREEKVLRKLSSMISLNVDSKTGLVSLYVEAYEPVLAAEMAQYAVENIQESIIRHQTSQVAGNLVFVEERFREQRDELIKAQELYFEYLDANRNRVAERTDIQERELNGRYNLSLKLYESIAEQVEQAKIAVKKETPAFSVIEPVTVPVEKSYPRRSIIAIASLFLGVFLGVFLVIGSALYHSIRQKWGF